MTSATTTNTAASGGSSTTEEAPFDPLSAALAEDEPVDDPLSLMAAQADEGAPMDPLSLAVAAASSASAETLGSKKVMGDEFEPWEARKAGILAKYTTSERLSIQSSFLGGGTQVVKNPVSTSDKVQQRLEQLDDDADVRELMDLSQSEYVMRINELNEELKSAWSKDARVRSLKLVIQSAKLLGDTSVLAFFPSKSVLVYDILDSFGELVFQRIRAKVGVCWTLPTFVRLQLTRAARPHRTPFPRPQPSPLEAPFRSPCPKTLRQTKCPSRQRSSPETGT